MGMSTHVVGFKPPDENWKAMKEVRDVCLKNDLPIPEYVDHFFEDVEPDENGVEVDLEHSTCLRPWKDEMRQGFELIVENIPKDVKIVRFYNSW